VCASTIAASAAASAFGASLIARCRCSPAVDPSARLGHPEIEQQSGAFRPRRRLGKRAAQQHGLRLVSPLPRGCVRGLDQARRYPIICRGLTDEQMLGHALGPVGLLAEQSCGAAVVLRAPSW
jgi:hypothetical protein